jgi:hypothetical protein
LGKTLGKSSASSPRRYRHRKSAARLLASALGEACSGLSWQVVGIEGVSYA